MRWACSTHARAKMYTKFWLENFKGRDHSKYLGIDVRITLDWILGK